MKFDFKRRQATFGVFNNRRENHGPEEKVKAIDLPFRFPMKPKECDMVCPANGVPLSRFLFGEDLRKPELQTHLLQTIYVSRKPEHVQLTIYDKPGNKTQRLTFKDTKVKDPAIELDEDGEPWCTGKFQFIPGAHLQRVSDNVEDQVLEFECHATQPELLDAPDEPDETDDGQQTLPGTEGAEESAEDDDDDEDE